MLSSTFKNALAYYNAGVVAVNSNVNSKIVGLAPVFQNLKIGHRDFCKYCCLFGDLRSVSYLVRKYHT
jgi:hypothetical protein